MRIHTFGRIKPSQIVGSGCLLAGVVCNTFVIEALFAGDGKISALPVKIGILVAQGFFILAGILYFRQAYRLLATLGVGGMLMFAFQFWLRMFMEMPFPEKRMFQALPAPPAVFAAGRQYRDQISRYEERFQQLIALLPPHSTVGYLTSETLPFEEAKLHYGLTTYALSPMRVVWATDYPFVIGNVPDFKENRALQPPPGLVLRRDFGNGTFLFQRETAQ